MDLNGNPTSCTRFLNRKLREFLYSVNGRIMMVYVHIFAFNIYHVVRKIYKQRYKIPEDDYDGRKQQQHSERKVSNDHQSDSAYNQQASNNWHWRNLPRMPSFFLWYRLVNTVYFVYVIIKYMLPNVSKFLVDQFNPSKPVHCYTIGRFILYEQVREVCAAFFACFHLVWRLFMIYDHQPIAIGTFYFLFLDDRDILRYYKMLNNHSNFIVVKRTGTISKKEKQHKTRPDILRPADAHLNMMHDIMSFRVDGSSRFIFKLRPNRTPKACRNLRDYLVITTLISTLVFGIIVCLIVILLVYTGFDDRTILARYPNCDPQLEQLKRDGLVSQDKWSLHFTSYVIASLIFDILENLFLWFDSGIVLYSCVVCTLLLNYDLSVQWNHLDYEIETLLKQARGERGLGKQSEQIKTGTLRKRKYEESIYELQMGICDFIMNLHRSNELIGDCFTTIICVWFTLFAYFIYGTILRSEYHIMPVVLFLMLICVFLVTTVLSVITISVHRNCLKSYSKICSLMAIDTSRHKRNFTEILDYFIRRRTCYTIYRGYPMTATTYLTIIGYSFSCFFILGSVNKRR